MSKITSAPSRTDTIYLEFVRTSLDFLLDIATLGIKKRIYLWTYLSEKHVNKMALEICDKYSGISFGCGIKLMLS